MGDRRAVGGLALAPLDQRVPVELLADSSPDCTGPATVDDADHRQARECGVVDEGAHGLASALHAPPEIVLVDIGLPGLDGYEVARRLRSTHPEILLVAVTGYGLDEDREHALAAGFDVHLVKPLDLAALQAVLAG